jgi:hypothetical protein
MSIVDADGLIWYREDQIEVPLTAEEEAALYADDDGDWELTPEQQAQFDALQERDRQAEEKLKAERGFETEGGLTDDCAMRFAQGVQAIWDEVGRPCRLSAAGRRAKLTGAEFILGAYVAKERGLVRHPTLDGVLFSTLWEPGVG